MLVAHLQRPEVRRSHHVAQSFGALGRSSGAGVPFARFPKLLTNVLEDAVIDNLRMKIVVASLACQSPAQSLLVVSSDMRQTMNLGSKR